MCGIAGVLDATASRGEAELAETAARMADCLSHRGPDDRGTWADGECGIGLGFRRLAILDLTAAGHQPMLSADSRYVLVFNGEIYNHRELRAELTGYPFRGQSDTEAILAAFCRWGIADATSRFNGMFAFAVWDRKHRSLTLGRDRIGEKPLYYGRLGGDFLFASELKSLRACQDSSLSIDRGSIALLMRHGYIPAPYSIYDGIRKLEPGTILQVDHQGGWTAQSYWCARDVALKGLKVPFSGSEAEAVEELHTRLRSSVGLRLQADVPLGAFLSGGIDSSLVVALMQAQTSEPVRTFSIGFSEDAFDEAPFARAVATYLRTDHTELYVTPAEARAVIPRLATIYDEPFADSSQIPTYLVSALARRDVVVSLSGDGGDELFGGYSRYMFLDHLWSRFRLTPLAARRGLASAIGRVPISRWDAWFERAGPFLPHFMVQSHPGQKMHKLAPLLRSRTAGDVYYRLISIWQDPASVVVVNSEPPTVVTRNDTRLMSDQPSLEAMFLDSISYLPDDIMAKVDRAAMAVGLETRMPLVDHTLYEFAWSLPISMRVKSGMGKHLLRQVLGRYVPRGLTERPKMGFGVPIGEWLRHPLREWAEDLLNEHRLRDQGLLNSEIVRDAWAKHVIGRDDLGPQLWAVLMFEAWLTEWA